MAPKPHRTLPTVTMKHNNKRTRPTCGRQRDLDRTVAAGKIEHRTCSGNNCLSRTDPSETAASQSLHPKPASAAQTNQTGRRAQQVIMEQAPRSARPNSTQMRNVERPGVDHMVPALTQIPAGSQYWSDAQSHDTQNPLWHLPPDPHEQSLPQVEGIASGSGGRHVPCMSLFLFEAPQATASNVTMRRLIIRSEKNRVVVFVKSVAMSLMSLLLAMLRPSHHRA